MSPRTTAGLRSPASTGTRDRGAGRPRPLVEDRAGLGTSRIAGSVQGSPPTRPARTEGRSPAARSARRPRAGGDRQRRVVPRRDGDLDARRRGLDEPHSRVLTVVAFEQVIVVDCETHSRRRRRDSAATAAGGSTSRARPMSRPVSRPSSTTRPSAAPMYVQRTVWSLSWMSIVSQAGGHRSTSDRRRRDSRAEPGRRDQEAAEAGPLGRRGGPSSGRVEPCRAATAPNAA